MGVEVLAGSGKPLFLTFLHFVMAVVFGVVARYLGNQIFRPFLEYSGVQNGCGSLARIRETTFLHFVLAAGFGVVARYLANHIFRAFLELADLRNACGKSCKDPGNHFSSLFSTLCWQWASEL